MGRSVARPADPGTITVYAEANPEENEYWDEYWNDVLYCLRAHAGRAWPSMEPADDWAGDELHIIARNALASLVVAAYGDLVSVSLVPDLDNPLSRPWVRNAAPALRKIVRAVFGDALCLVATASNGESFFRRDAR